MLQVGKLRLKEKICLRLYGSPIANEELNPSLWTHGLGFICYWGVYMSEFKHLHRTNCVPYSLSLGPSAFGAKKSLEIMTSKWNR